MALTLPRSRSDQVGGLDLTQAQWLENRNQLTEVPAISQNLEFPGRLILLMETTKEISSRSGWKITSPPCGKSSRKATIPRVASRQRASPILFITSLAGNQEPPASHTCHPRRGDVRPPRSVRTRPHVPTWPREPREPGPAGRIRNRCRRTCSPKPLDSGGSDRHGIVRHDIPFSASQLVTSLGMAFCEIIV